ncbi:hypothetical protein CO230_00710 [Chryseobacterium sp. 6424]|uniref:Ig-like domain-containing protein n=1 Tax=Chryseobacterium sp. 6424 TaxID=2039166 RepID=UPI000EFB27DF|nr:Ig-like domain-containing protein [Chryseobacterium sp. 6424]AYO56788.1 hypothetical protein CO230_00710 [Chryseobacterium sp. 6424]
MRKLFYLFIFTLLLQACARVGSPVGGDRDTLAPQVTGSNIDTPRVNVPLDIRELRIDFDEYITLKDINRQLIISPPLQKMTKIIPSGTPNRYLLIKWDDTLKANTTYNFNFGNAIQDNNEGNPLRYYNFAFSTGEKIDELYISGELKTIFENSTNSKDERNLVVGLYRDQDSLNYRQKPYYITKADPDGYYELNYLSPGNYRILAFEDSNSNSVYDPGNENVGFSREPITLDKSISGLNITLYPSRKSVRYVEMKETPGGILMIFEGNPDRVKVASLNEKLQDYKITHRPKSDSVNIWFDAEKSNIGITASENLRFSYDNGVTQDTVSTFYRYNTKNEMIVSNAKGNMLPPGNDFAISSNYAIDTIDPQKWTLVSDSTQQPFTARISARNPYEIHITSDFKEGKKYSLTVPRETVSSFYETITKSYRFDFETDRTENYGSFILTLENAPQNKYWLQLLTENNTIAYSVYSSGNQQIFTALKPGRYRARLLVDSNENGLWEAADLASGTFAEEVYLYHKTVDVRPLWEIRESWDLKNTEIAKQPATATSDNR